MHFLGGGGGAPIRTQVSQRGALETETDALFLGGRRGEGRHSVLKFRNRVGGEHLRQTQTDRPTNRQTDRDRDRHKTETDRLTDRRTDRRTGLRRSPTAYLSFATGGRCVGGARSTVQLWA